MADKYVATFKVDGKSSGFRELANDAEGFRRVLGATIQQSQNFNARVINFAAISQGISAAQGAINSLAGTLRELSNAYAVQETAERKLETVMRQRMGASAQDIQAIKDLTSAQQLGVIGDEVQLAGAQQVATFVTQRSTLETLIPAMNNLIAQQYGLTASQGDATSVANLMGKAMQGQTSALRRVGITFTSAQEQIMKFGDESQRAAMLAQIITDNVGDMNAELAKTDSGKQKQLENTLGDIKEKLGKLATGAMPFVTIAAQSTTALLGVSKLALGIKTLTAATAGYITKARLQNAVTLLCGRSTASTTAVTRVFSAALRGTAYSATAAKLAIRGLLTATGVGAAIVALTMALEALFNWLDKDTDAMNDLSTAEGRAARDAERAAQLREQENATLEQNRAALALNIEKLRTFNGTKAEEKRLVDEMNGTYGETMGYFSKVSEWYEALQANSEKYCRQMVLEARLRTLANQVAAKEQEKHDLTYDESGNLRQHSTQRQTREVYDGTTTYYDATGQSIYQHNTRTEEVQGSSEKEIFEATVADINDTIESLNGQMRAAAEEVANITFEVKGANTRPTETGTTSAPAANNTPQLTEQAATIGEIEENIRYYQEALKSATAETAPALLASKAQWEALRESILNVSEAAVRIENPKSLNDLTHNLQVARTELNSADSDDRVKELNQEIKGIEALIAARQQLGVEEAAPVKNDSLHETHNSLQDINDDLGILQERLQTARFDEIPGIRAQIEQLEKLRDSYENAGKAGLSAMQKFRKGWNAAKGIGNGIESISDALKGNANWWQKTVKLVDGALAVYEGITAIVELINTLATVTGIATTATVAKTAATTADAVATGVAITAEETSAAASVPAIAANKALTASFTELAAAKYMAAHAYIPFVGFGIGSGFTTAMLAMVKAAGLPMFAEGGLAYGPTLGIFGEYAGAKNNPEVVAPLDKLKGMLDSDGGRHIDIGLKLEGRTLVGCIEREYKYRGRAK